MPIAEEDSSSWKRAWKQVDSAWSHERQQTVDRMKKNYFGSRRGQPRGTYKERQQQDFEEQRQMNEDNGMFANEYDRLAEVLEIEHPRVMIPVGCMSNLSLPGRFVCMHYLLPSPLSPRVCCSLCHSAPCSSVLFFFVCLCVCFLGTNG